MIGKAHTAIEIAVSKKKGGEILFLTDFRGTGTQSAIKKTFSRLTEKGIIKRLAHGIYYTPKKDPVLGELIPGPEEVLRMIAKKEKITIKPSGAYALHKLGLTTQVPTKMVYLTDGPPKQLKLGKLEIKLKATTPKKLATKGKISGLVMQALEEIGTCKLSPATEQRIKELLLVENTRDLEHDLKLFSTRINDYIVRLLKNEQHVGLADTK